MLNKNFWLKTILLVSSIVWLSLSFSSAALFNINLGTQYIQAISEEAIAQNLIPIHFVDNWNDFGWFIYMPDDAYFEAGNLPLWDSISGELVQFQDDEWYICSQQVSWYYYNSERWERLWPLHDGIWVGVQQWLTTNGWLYTRCVSQSLSQALATCTNLTGEDEEQCESDAWAEFGNLRGYYGMVTHTYAWKTFGLIAGTQYSLDNEGEWLSVNNSGLTENFIRYENNTAPVGLIYDYNGWVWFVWCEFTSDKTTGLRTFVAKMNAGSGIDEMFDKNEDGELVYSWTDIALNCSDVWASMNSLIRMVVEWLVWIGENSNVNIVWNQLNPKMQYFKSVSVNNATLVNYTKKKAESLCRWKWKKYGYRHDTIYKTHMENIGINNLRWRQIYSNRKWYLSGGVNDNFGVSSQWSGALTRWNAQHQNWKSKLGHTNYESLLCIETSHGETVLAEPWYTYIVKGGWNVMVTPMLSGDDDSYYYDVYVLDSWNLVLDSASPAEMRLFTTGGFIYEVNKNTPFDVIPGYINDIQAAVTSWESYHGNYAAVAAFIKWNFVVDWNLVHVCSLDSNIYPWVCLTENSINNRYFVYWKFTTRDSVSNLDSLFSWRCDNWISSNTVEKYCPISSVSANWENPYENAPLVIVDQNYDSPVFNW